MGAQYPTMSSDTHRRTQDLPFALYAAKDVARIQVDGLSADQMGAAMDKASATMGFRASRRVAKRAR